MTTYEDYKTRINSIKEKYNTFTWGDDISGDFYRFLNRENLEITKMNSFHYKQKRIYKDIKKIWERLPKEEKEKFDYQIIKFQEKYIRFCIIDKYINFLENMEKKFSLFFPKWKKKIYSSLYYEIINETNIRILLNIDIREQNKNIGVLYNFFLTDYEKKRIEFFLLKLENVRKRLIKSDIYMEDYMKIFYKGNLKSINSYDIRRYIFSFF